MNKIDVVAQAPYPVPLPSGAHLEPGGIARKIDRTPEVETQIELGFLREVDPSNIPSVKEEITPRKPRAEVARDENQED